MSIGNTTSKFLLQLARLGKSRKLIQNMILKSLVTVKNYSVITNKAPLSEQDRPFIGYSVSREVNPPPHFLLWGQNSINCMDDSIAGCNISTHNISLTIDHDGKW